MSESEILAPIRRILEDDSIPQSAKLGYIRWLVT